MIVATADKTAQIVANIQQVIVGKTEAVRMSVAALLADGHMLIEDLPGVGKTSLARALARSVHGVFKRVQCTPDLLPSDLTGVSIFDQSRQDFVFRPGPVFANIVLADEVNRATPKSQSALLECMEERQVTVDGVSHQVARPFMVIATENPIEYEGTYVLPEAQLDRFLVKIRLGYPEPEEEVTILERQQERRPLEEIQPVVDSSEVLELQAHVRSIYVEDSLKRYIVELVGATRHHPEVELGASPRGSLALLRLGQALAALDGRDYVIPEDLRAVAVAALAHRVALAPEREMRGLSPETVIGDILDTHPAPLGRRRRQP